MRRIAPVVAIALAALLAGCAEDIDARYGVLHGPSVNGIRLFRDFLIADGHTVGVAGEFRDSLERQADVIVVFLHGFDQMDHRSTDWIKRWLSRGRDRHVILVVRDSDEQIAYFDHLLEDKESKLELTQYDEYRRRRDIAVSAFLDSAKRSVARQADMWYGLDSLVDPPIRRVSALEVDPSWTEGTQWRPEGCDVRFHRRIVLGPTARRLVWSGDDVLLARIDVQRNNIWIASNGSFLLNYGLVNHQHRRLALTLSRSLGRQRRVVFVASGGVIDEAESRGGLLRFLAVTPINWIVGHFVLVALLYCWSRFPIFGKPLVTPQREQYDFGRHVDALGRLLARRGDFRFAQEKVRRYFENERSAGGGLGRPSIRRGPTTRDREPGPSITTTP